MESENVAAIAADALAGDFMGLSFQRDSEGNVFVEADGKTFAVSLSVRECETFEGTVLSQVQSLDSCAACGKTFRIHNSRKGKQNLCDSCREKGVRPPPREEPFVCTVCGGTSTRSVYSSSSVCEACKPRKAVHDAATYVSATCEKCGGTFERYRAHPYIKTCPSCRKSK